MDYIALPKIELHAHLTGSVSRKTLHEIWKLKHAAGETALEDPQLVMPDGKHDYNLKTFFPLFSNYIYNLLTDRTSIMHATTSVLRDFEADGVVYLELRTTPRPTPHLTLEEYVSAITDAIAAFPTTKMHTKLILCVDRRHEVATAEKILDLCGGEVVGLDLCGDPTAKPRGEIDVFTGVFETAKQRGLGVTVHFAEAEASGSQKETEVLLSWEPGRLGHVIWEGEGAKKVIEERGLCLELCLSCNVLAGMVEGGFGDHHFGYWRGRGVMIALSTDDVGVFGSPLSNEYRLAGEHFNLSRQEICDTARSCIDGIFGGEHEKQRLRDIMWK